MFHPDIVGTLHTRRTGTRRILRRIAFIIDKLDISWDPSISPTFSGEDLTWFAAYVFLDLPSPIADLLQKPVPPHRLGSTLMNICWIHDHHHGLIEPRFTLDRVEFSPTPGE